MKFIRVLKANDRDLKKYIKDVQTNLPKEFARFQQEADNMLKDLDPSLKAVKVDLSGSYKTGKATEDSDIDIVIYYTGNMEQDEVNEKLLQNSPLFSSNTFGLLDSGFVKID